MRRENRELKLEVARMRMRLTDLEKDHISIKQELVKSNPGTKLFKSFAKKISKLGSLFSFSSLKPSLSAKASSESRFLFQRKRRHSVSWSKKKEKKNIQISIFWFTLYSEPSIYFFFAWGVWFVIASVSIALYSCVCDMLAMMFCPVFCYLKCACCENIIKFLVYFLFKLLLSWNSFESLHYILLQF